MGCGVGAHCGLVHLFERYEGPIAGQNALGDVGFHPGKVAIVASGQGLDQVHVLPKVVLPLPV